MRIVSGLKLGVMLYSVAVCFPLASVATEELVNARWEIRQVEFRYSGFNTHYTCSGLSSKVKKLLTHFGAQNARIAGPCLGPRHEPQLFHRLILAFVVPVPVVTNTHSGAAVATDTFKAVWERREVRTNRPRYIDGGDCELVEEVRRQVLPYFTVQGLDVGLRCPPHRRSFGGLATSLIMLQPVDKELVPPELPELFQLGDLPGVEDATEEDKSRPN